MASLLLNETDDDCVSLATNSSSVPCGTRMLRAYLIATRLSLRLERISATSMSVLAVGFWRPKRRNLYDISRIFVYQSLHVRNESRYR